MRKWLIALASLVIVAILIGGIWKNYAQQAFDRLVKDRLISQYDFNYSKIELDFWQRQIQVEDFILTPDSTNQDARQYQVKVATFKLELASILPILFSKKLTIKGVTIIDPELVVRQKKEQLNAEQHFTTESFSLLDLITKYVALFEVNNLTINSASFQHQNISALDKVDDFMLREINFFLNQFSVDSTLQKQNFFNAESIELIINEEYFFLNDQIHQLSFDQLRLSTKDSSLTVNGIKLRPVHNDVLSNQQIIDKHHIFDIEVPEIALVGVNFEESYLNQTLAMKQLRIKEPNIFVREKSQIRERISAKNNAILSIIEQFSPSLSIEQVLLESGNIDLDLHQYKDLELKLNVDSFSLFDLAIDSTDLYFDYEHPPFSGFSVSLSNIDETIFNQKDNFHCDHVHINSLDSILLLKNFQLNKPSQFKQILPEFKITGLDYLGVLFHKPLYLSSIQLKSPKTYLQYVKQENNTAKPISPLIQLQEALTKANIQPIQVALLSIENGSFDFENQLSIDNYQSVIKDLRINPSVNSWKSLLGTLNLNLNQVEYQTDTLELKFRSLETNGIDHQFDKLYFSQKSIRNEISLQIDQISVFNTDPDSLFQNKIQLDSLEINKPIAVINLSDHSKKEKPQNQLRFPFPIPKLEVLQGVIELKLPNGDQLTIPNLDAQLSIDSVEFDLLDLMLKELSYRPKKLDHHFKIKEFKQFDSSSYGIRDLTITPNSNAPHLYPIKIPSLDIIDLNREKLIDDGVLMAQSITIEDIASNIQLGNTPTTQPSNAKSTILPKIQVDSFLVRNGQASLKIKDSLDLELPNFDFILTGINTEEGQFNINRLKDYFQDLSLTTNDTFHFSTANFEADISNLKFEASDLISLYLSTINLSKESIFQTNIDTIKAQDIDWQPFVKDKQVILKELQIAQVDLFIPSKPEKVDQDDALDTKISLPLNALELERLSIENMVLHLPKSNPLKINGIDIQLEKLKVDSIFDLNQMDDYFQNLQFNVKEISSPIGKWEEYQFSQSLHYDSRSQQLVSRDIQLARNYDKFEYSNFLANRKDYFDISIDSIILFSWELNHMLKKATSIQKNCHF